MPRTHDRDFFYKYMTSKTAKIVLGRSCLRWTSPVLFSDPFDHQADFQFQFTKEEFVEEYLKEIEDVVFGENDVTIDTSTKVGIELSLMRSRRHKVSKDDVMNELRKIAIGMGQKLSKIAEELNRLLQEQLESTRVLCVSEKNDNVVMWSHYADKHKGVVLRLQCIDELDNNLLVARKLQYQKEFPAIASVEETAKHLVRGYRVVEPGLANEVAYIKHYDWRYEDEWRVVASEPGNNGNLFNDYRENPRIFGAVYFGCRISDKDKEDILNLLSGRLAHVEAYQANKRKQEFGIDFERIH